MYWRGEERKKWAIFNSTQSQIAGFFKRCNLGENWTNSSRGHQDLSLPIGHNWHSDNLRKTKEAVIKIWVKNTPDGNHKNPRDRPLKVSFFVPALINPCSTFCNSGIPMIPQKEDPISYRGMTLLPVSYKLIQSWLYIFDNQTIIIHCRLHCWLCIFGYCLQSS